MKKIIYYRKENWEYPFVSIMDILEITNKKIFAKISFKIDLLSKWKLWNEDVKYIWDKIYELRIKQSSNIFRTFYFTYKWDFIVILDWFIKKDNKIKQSILNKVKWYMLDFLTRTWN